MRTQESVGLPISGPEYNQSDEQRSRRQIEEYVENLRVDIIETRDGSDKFASLANRRFQFLLMGAS